MQEVNETAGSDQLHDEQVEQAEGAVQEATEASPDWQQRAEEAEARLAEIADRLGEVEQAASELHSAIEAQRLARLVDVSLVRAGASDLDAARSVLMEWLGDEAGAAEVAQQIERLRSQRPGLFGAGVAGQAAGTHGELRAHGGGVLTEAQRAADEARTTGDRRQLLRYLRLRRASVRD